MADREELFFDLGAFPTPAGLPPEWAATVKAIALERFAADLRKIRCADCNAAVVVTETPTEVTAEPGCLPTCPIQMGITGPFTEETS